MRAGKAAGTIVGVLSLLMCVAAVYPVPARAVTADKSGGGEAGALLVAGNPDNYPIEYYDREAGEYRGLIPDMLARAEEQTDFRFTYIYAGGENRQAELADNRQVELVTAADGVEASVADSFPVYTVTEDGEKKVFSICFTDLMPRESAEELREAIESISEEEKNGIILSYAGERRTDSRTAALFCVLAFAGGLLLSLVCVLIFTLCRRKKARKEDMTDHLTGVGSAAYYAYTFDAFISGQARSLYSVAYIAFDYSRAERHFGAEVCEDIQRYAASDLNARVCSAEYLSRVTDGAFALAFQAGDVTEVEERVKAAVDGLNSYLADFDGEWSSLFSAGVCRLADRPDCGAESALYAAKQGCLHARESGVSFIAETGDGAALAKRNTALRAHASEAVRRGEFKIYMQFITESASSAICGAEALSRWQHPEYGLLRPHEYIGLLKDSGKIVAHDYAVFEGVCAQLERWSESPLACLFIACNFTRMSISCADFSDRIKEISEKYTFEHSRLVIEITEDTLSPDSEETAENIRRCKAMGFGIAIDDMGTGFSSLADLYSNDIDIVKIEHSFTSRLTSERRHRILRDIIALVHNTGARVICEGIETKEQQEDIKSMGCDMLQGFYYSRVLPLPECERFLAGKDIRYLDIISRPSFL